jgi:hypothetical protein
LNTIYITRRLFSNRLTIPSRLSTVDWV